MKKIFAVLVLPFVFSVAYAAEEKTDDRLLEETVALSKKVKEFERTIGIEPTKALSKSSKEMNPSSVLFIWLKKRGESVLNKPHDAKINIHFSKAKEAVPLAYIRESQVNHSIYHRIVNQFSGSDSAITPDFASSTPASQVNIILHEDIHANMPGIETWEINESVTTALGYWAALYYFMEAGDANNAEKILSEINYWRDISRELTEFAAEADKIFALSEHPESIYVLDEILRLLSLFPAYEKMYRDQIKGQENEFVLEAKISHDLAYWRYFDAISSLIEKSGDIRLLIEDFKNTPTKAGELEKYLDMLEQKYSNPAR